MQTNERTLLSGHHTTQAIPDVAQPWLIPACTAPASCETVTSQPAIKMSIVSNSQLLREGLVKLLVAHIDLELIGSYPASMHVPAALTNPVNHIVLLDGSINFAALQTWIAYWRGLTPPALILVLELVHDNDMVLACIEAGANGYVLRGASAAELAQAITLAQQGLAHCTPDVTAQMFARLAAYRRASSQPLQVQTILTPRELEVLHCIAAGWSNQDIANRLVIGVRTVKHHVHNILEKLKLRRRWEAAHFAVEQGWIDTDLPSHE